MPQRFEVLQFYAPGKSAVINSHSEQILRVEVAGQGEGTAFDRATQWAHTFNAAVNDALQQPRVTHARIVERDQDDGTPTYWLQVRTGQPSWSDVREVTKD